jgi:hypothetical protein
MKIRLSAVCTLLVFLAAPVVAQQVSVNYVKTQNFSNFHTFAWGEENHKAVEKMFKKYPKT